MVYIHMVYILIDKWFTKLTRRQKTSPSLFLQAQTLQSEKSWFPIDQPGSSTNTLKHPEPHQLTRGQVQTLQLQEKEEEKVSRKLGSQSI